MTVSVAYCLRGWACVCLRIPPRSAHPVAVISYSRWNSSSVSEPLSSLDVKKYGVSALNILSARLQKVYCGIGSSRIEEAVGMEKRLLKG